MTPSDEFTKSAWMLASVAVVVAALYLAKSVLAPLALALLLSFMLSPICDWLEQWRLGRIPAVLITTILGFAILGAAGWTVVVQMTDLAPNVPGYQKNVEAKWRAVNSRVTALVNQVTKTTESMQATPSKGVREPAGTDESPYAVRIVTSPLSPLQLFGGIFGTLLEFLGSTALVVVLVAFFLVRRDDLRDRFIRLAGQGDVTQTTQMLEDASLRVTRYLSMQLLVNSAFGALAGLGLSLIGVPNALLWGILAVVLKFIPYLGAWIAAALPLALSMAISKGWAEPALTIGLYAVLEFVSGNVFEPWLYGKNTGISAVAVLLAAVFWTWLWGIVGLLLATPLTVCLLVIGKHVPRLSFLDTLLGNEPVFELNKRVYQRLVAGDQREATELLDESLALHPLVEVYDGLMLPVLVEAETNWRRGGLSEDRHTFILQCLKAMIREQDEVLPEPDQGEIRSDQPIDAALNRPGETGAAKRCVLCLPAQDVADEVAGMMLAQTLAIPDCLVETAPPAISSRDLIEFAVHRRPDVICISATRPSVLRRVRNLCLRLRRSNPAVPVVVGLWGASDELNKAQEQIGTNGTIRVVTTLEGVRVAIVGLLQPAPQ